MQKNPRRPTEIHHKTQNWWPTKIHKFTTKPRKTTASTTKDSKTTPQNPKLDQILATISATTRDSREEIKLNLSHNSPNQTNNIHQIGANLNHDPRSTTTTIHWWEEGGRIGEKRGKERERERERERNLGEMVRGRGRSLSEMAWQRRSERGERRDLGRRQTRKRERNKLIKNDSIVLQCGLKNESAL